jgi:Flp pilus assembly protein TadD
MAYQLFRRGMELLKTRKPAQAVAFLEKAKSIYPNKGSIREALARAYFNNGQYELALEEFSKAVDIDPTNHYAHFGLGLCLEKKGRTRLALGHIKLAVAMEPYEEVYRIALNRLNR